MPTEPSSIPHRTSRFKALVARVQRDRQHQSATDEGWRRPHWVAVVFSVVLLAFAGFAIVPFAKAHLQAAAVLNEVAGQPVAWPLRAFAHHRVAVSDVTLPDENGQPIHARLYLPDGDMSAPGMVVLHGVHHLGMHEPRLIAFAQAMASCGLRVLTPELPGIADYHVTPESIRTIGNSAVWLARQNPAHDLQPVSVLGLSFSGGLSLLAAADPVYHPAIRLVVTVGSQDEMSRVAAYYRTGTDEQPNGSPEVLPPHEYGALVLEYEHLGDFVPAQDLVPLRALLRAHLYEDVAGEAAVRAKLSPRQQGEAVQLLNAHSPATQALLAAEEQRRLREMAGVSPHGHLATLDTPVYLLHGAGDNIIPAAETLWMARELPHNSLQAVLVSPVLSHLDLDGAAPGWLDRWRLVHFFALILHAAEQR